MEINKLLTPHNYKIGTADRIKYIVIHYVGATGGAEANCKYYAEKYRGASAHYFVGFNGEIWQSVEDQNIAWHCGGKKYANTAGGAYHGICTNANSIGIEMCVRKDEKNGAWYFEDATVYTTIELTKLLMRKYNIPEERVIRHYDVTGKKCPDPYVRYEEAWQQFKAEIVTQQESGWIKDDKGWWYRKADTVRSYYAGEWANINGHRYYFNEDGYAVTGWQQIAGEWYYFEPTKGHPLECALYVSDKMGVQRIGDF